MVRGRYLRDGAEGGCDFQVQKGCVCVCVCVCQCFTQGHFDIRGARLLMEHVISNQPSVLIIKRCVKEDQHTSTQQVLALKGQ